MSRSIDQVERLIALIPYLRAHPGVRVGDAARAFGVRPAKIKEDVRKLFLCGLPGGMPDDLIELDLDALESDGVIQIGNADFFEGPIRLFRAEAVSLLLALHSLRATAEDDARVLIDSTIGKLETAVGGHARVAVHLHDVDPAVRRAVTTAVERQERLEILYLNVHRDDATRRRVDPLGIFTEQGRTYLSAWCHLAQERRTFRLDAIAEVATTGDSVATKRSRGASRPSARYSPADDDHWADFEIQAEGRWLLDAVANDVLEESAETTTVRLRSHDPGWLVRFALQNAWTARILGPDELVARVREEARRALHAYDGG